MPTALPVIDLSSSDTPATVATLRSACEDVGFFYIENHGIPKNLLDSVLEQSRRLFALPTDEKIRLSDPKMSRGYTAMEEETLDPANQPNRGDTKEGYYIGRDVPESHKDYNPAKLKGPNVWPVPEKCSLSEAGCDEFKRIMEAYFARASDVSFRLVQLIAQAIGLDRHHFDDNFTENFATIRLLHYAAEKSRPQEGVYACGAHSDYGMVTLLLTDDNPGLQILTLDNRWIDVPPRPGAFIVNLGDMLERWTNGMFRSTVHRVLTSGDRERYSIPFFYEPDFDTRVACLDVCESEDRPPRYKPTTAGQHLLDKYLQTHADFKPDSE